MSIHWLRAVLLLVLLSSFSGAQSRAEEALRRELRELEDKVSLVEDKVSLMGWASGAALLVSLGCWWRGGG